MASPIYNSRDRRYKSKYGALDSGESGTYRRLLPFQSGAVCYRARLLVLNDADNSEKSYELFGTDEYEGDCRWWEVVYTAEEPGLY